MHCNHVGFSRMRGSHMRCSRIGNLGGFLRTSAEVRQAAGVAGYLEFSPPLSSCHPGAHP